MDKKLLGGILLITGTTIGAGMLALPMTTAQLGFLGSLIMLTGCWLIVLICCNLFLEVNLWLPEESNLISMAKMTLGLSGQAVAWISYLLLLYSLLAAYISGGGDVLRYTLLTNGINISAVIANILFVVVFGIVVYLGIRAVDYVNRGLMFGKMGALLILILLLIPFISTKHLSQTNFHYFTSPTSISVTVLAFCCFMIIPSLRAYFGNETHKVRQAIFIGTLIPLISYILWDMVIMGIIPLDGLAKIMHSNNSNSDLIIALNNILNSQTIILVAKFFTSICMTTAFLSVALSLSDFLSDGLNIKKVGMGNIVIFSLTFIPPVAAVLLYPDAFIRGLSYAGICIFMLMVLFPPLMVWRGRYHQARQENGYQVKGGKLLLALLLVFATLMIGFGIEAAV